MRNLASVISRLISPPEGEVPLLTRELIRHFRQEYDAFLARYAGVDRPRPEMPDDADLAREPQWGMVATRLFRIQVRQFEEWAAR